METFLAVINDKVNWREMYADKKSITVRLTEKMLSPIRDATQQIAYALDQ